MRSVPTSIPWKRIGFRGQNKQDFIGREALLAPKRRLKEDRRPRTLGAGIARADYPIEAEGRVIGRVTTGYMIPTTGKAYAFGLIESAYSDIGVEVLIHIRKNKIKAKVRNKKFLEKKYIK